MTERVANGGEQARVCVELIEYRTFIGQIGQPVCTRFFRMTDELRIEEFATAVLAFLFDQIVRAVSKSFELRIGKEASERQVSLRIQKIDFLIGERISGGS